MKYAIIVKLLFIRKINSNEKRKTKKEKRKTKKEKRKTKKEKH